MKLLVCDVEGTIFAARYRIDGMDYASTMWQPLAKSLGDEGIRREKEMHDRWERGEYSNYLDWVRDTCEMHRELGLTSQMFNSLLSQAVYNPGVFDFFAKLDRKQYLPVFISGGFQELVRRAQRELNAPHGHGACEYFFDPNDHLLHSYSLTLCDFEWKYSYIEILLKQYNLDKRCDWLFIGDGKNDCDVARKAPISFAYNGHPQLREIATYQIGDGGFANFNDIRQILDELTEEDFAKGHQRNIDRQQKESTINKQTRKDKEIKKSHDQILVLDEDYIMTPKLHLSEILEEHSIAFIGMRANYKAFKTLESHFADAKKFKLIEANFEHKNNMDFKALRRRDFIFVDVDCVSHSQGWRVEELGVPFARIKGMPGNKNDAEPLERAMSNVLYRCFYEEQ